MIKKLIERAIDTDEMMVVKRTGYIQQSVSADSENELGVSLTRGDVLHLYITGELKGLTEMEQRCARLLIEAYRRKFNDTVFRLVMKFGAEETGRMYGSSGAFARTILVCLDDIDGTEEKAG